MADDRELADRLEALEARLRAALQALAASAGGAGAGVPDRAEDALRAERERVGELTARVEELEAARAADAEIAERVAQDHRAAIVAMTEKLERLQAEATELQADGLAEAADASEPPAGIEDLQARLEQQSQLAEQLRRQRDAAKQSAARIERELDDLRAERAAEAAQLKDLLDDLTPALDGAESHA